MLREAARNEDKRRNGRKNAIEREEKRREKEKKEKEQGEADEKVEIFLSSYSLRVVFGEDSLTIQKGSSAGRRKRGR